MPYKWISQEEISLDWDLNPREMDIDHIRSLAKHMNDEGFHAKYPIVVYEIGDDMTDMREYGPQIYAAATGHHRLEASMLEDDEFPNLPLTEVYCEVKQGTRAQFVRQMLVDNFQHVPGFNFRVGKMPTRQELRKMRYQLLFFPDIFEKGDRLLAKEWGCGKATINRLRNEFIENLAGGPNGPPDHISEADLEQLQKIVQADLYIGLDGKKYPRTVLKPDSNFSEDEIDIEPDDGVFASGHLLGIPLNSEDVSDEDSDSTEEIDEKSIAEKIIAIRKDLNNQRAKQMQDESHDINLSAIAKRHDVSVDVVSQIAQEDDTSEEIDEEFVPWHQKLKYNQDSSPTPAEPEPPAEEDSSEEAGYEDDVLKGFDPKEQRWLRVTVQIGRDPYGHNNISALVPDKFSHTVIHKDELSDDDLREMSEELAEILFKTIKVKRNAKE